MDQSKKNTKEMDVQILSTETIEPSSPTPPHLRTFKPSFLDQISAPFYIPLTLFYNSKLDPSIIPNVHGRLKKSLSETLTIFYPLAGRIHDMFSITCDDRGASYTEATVDSTLSEFLKNPNLNLLNKFLPRKTNNLEDGTDFQVSAQVSVFSCGGVAIGVSVFHQIVDMTSLAIFLKTWAGLCVPTAGEDVQNQDFPALDLGSSIFPPLTSFPDDYLALKSTLNFSDRPKHYVTRRFVFGASAIAALRAKSASAAVPAPSRVESLTGFLNARLMACLKKSSPAPSVFSTHAVNIRRRMDPPLPANAFGNFTWFAAAHFPSSEEIEMPDYVEGMKESLDGIDGEGLKEIVPETAIVSLYEGMAAMSEREREIKGYKFSSWCNMGFYDLDFGWGVRPIWVAQMGDPGLGRAKHQLMFLEGKNRAEIELWVLFTEEEMCALENDEEFLAFANPNPGIYV